MHCNDFLDLISFVGVYKGMPLEFRDTGFPRGGGKVNCYQGSADSFAAGADEKYLIISVTNANNSAQFYPRWGGELTRASQWGNKFFNTF